MIKLTVLIVVNDDISLACDVNVSFEVIDDETVDVDKSTEFVDFIDGDEKEDTEEIRVGEANELDDGLLADAQTLERALMLEILENVDEVVYVETPTVDVVVPVEVTVPLTLLIEVLLGSDVSDDNIDCVDV